jgi:DNA ligase (NAD+)
VEPEDAKPEDAKPEDAKPEDAKPEEVSAPQSIATPDVQVIEKSEDLPKKPKRVTLKKKPTASPANNFEDFKKRGISYLKTLPEAQLVEMIKQADKQYYCNQTPLLSDDQYDVLREYTVEKYPNNKEAIAGHTQCDMTIQKNKVKLPYEMWSMDKIKPDSGALAAWMAKYSGPYVISCKLDGVSGLYTTEGPTPKLYTRGNGTVGQDVSHMIPYLKLPKKSGIVIRGEFIIPKDIFASKYASKFANPRNFVAGVVNQKKVEADKFKDIDFVAYEVIKPDLKPSEQMAALTNMDVQVVMFAVEKRVSNELLSNLLVDWRQSYKYEVDGVICVNDAVYQRKRGNPEHAFAFKMVLGDQIAEVKVVDVIWTPSKDGYLKPRVQVEPITLGGVKIEYATGFNAKFIEDNKIGVGAVVKLIRSGDVIPHILEVVRPAPEALMPSVQYKWNETHVDIELVDKDEDSTVQEKVITGFFKGIGVDGMGAGIVKRIIAAGYDNVPKIIAMKEDDFLAVEGFKSKLASKVYNGIHENIAAASLAELMHATNIFGRGFGEKRFKAILEEIPDILVSKISDSEKEKLLTNVSGMAKKSASTFIEKIPEFLLWANEAGVQDKLVHTKPLVSVGVKEHPLYGKKVVMTGFRDKELAANIEKVGGENSGSVSKNTFVVLVKDVNEDTGKADQARKLGVKLMTPEEFKTKYGL